MEDTNCDEPKTLTAKSVLEVDSTTKSKESIENSSIVELKENASSESVKLVHNTLTTGNSQIETETHCNSAIEVEELVVSSTMNTQKMIAEPIPSTVSIEVVPNSLSNAREKEISCDSTSNSGDQTRRSTLVVLKGERAELKVSPDKLESKLIIYF